MNSAYALVPKDIISEEQLLRRAEVLAQGGQWGEAASLLQEYQQTNALSLEAFGKLAYYHSHAGAFDNAIPIYRNLCQQQPFKAMWFYALGFQYQQKEEWPDAIVAYKEALRLAPGWLKAALQLGDAYRKTQQIEKALSAYRQGSLTYRELTLARQHEEALVYGKICANAGRTFLDKPNRDHEELEKTIWLFRESVAVEPNNADRWYRLGCALLEADQVDEALDCLRKAEALDPKKDYIRHKIAQAYLKKNDADEALRIYEKIPQYRRVPYILHSMAQCHMNKRNYLEAAKLIHRAIQKEPGKFYHYWDFALALIALEARGQALEALEKTNQLFEREHGKEYQKALKKLEEVRAALPPGKQISLEEVSPSAVSEIRFGTVIKYFPERGFGFIKDSVDGVDVFFHIKRIKDQETPEIGVRAKYLREAGEKGPQAAKMWLRKER